MLTTIVRMFRAWKRYNQSLAELSRLGDRELAESESAGRTSSASPGTPPISANRRRNYCSNRPPSRGRFCFVRPLPAGACPP